jgi:hypothetical protein
MRMAKTSLSRPKWAHVSGGLLETISAIFDPNIQNPLFGPFKFNQKKHHWPRFINSIQSFYFCSVKNLRWNWKCAIKWSIIWTFKIQITETPPLLSPQNKWGERFLPHSSAGKPTQHLRITILFQSTNNEVVRHHVWKPFIISKLRN